MPPPAKDRGIGFLLKVPVPQGYRRVSLHERDWDHLGVLLSSCQRVTSAGVTGEAGRTFVEPRGIVNAIFFGGLHFLSKHMTSHDF